MNNGIKNKLKELMGKEVNLSVGHSGVYIRDILIRDDSSWGCKVLRFENDDCVVLGNDSIERYISIDRITFIDIKMEKVI